MALAALEYITSCAYDSIALAEALICSVLLTIWAKSVKGGTT